MSEPWCSESVTLPLALGSLGAPSFLCHRSLLGALVLSACLRDRSLLVAAVFRDVYVAARSGVPCPLAAGSHGVIWRIWGFWGVFWKSFGGPVRALLGRLGPFWAIVGPFGPPRGVLEAFGRLGALLGASWEPLGALLGLSRVLLGLSWGAPGASWGPSGGHFCLSGVLFGGFWRSSNGFLAKSRKH